VQRVIGDEAGHSARQAAAPPYPRSAFMRCIVGTSGGLATLALALSLTACGGGGGPTGTPAGGNNNNGGNTGGSTSANIDIGTGTSFSPSATTVPTGTTVTWSWNSCGSDGYGGQTCVDHNVTWDDGAAPASGTKSSGSYTRTFATAGTYGYHCSIHGTTSGGMHGTVTVQ
jgi:plastocyanin